jgi:chemotaxis protein MotD
MQANPAGADPAPNSVSVIAATAASAGKAVPDNASAAFMAKVAASQNGGGPGGSQQGAAGAASTSAPDAKPVASQIPQIVAGQGSGNTDADPDGQGGDGQSGKAAQNAGQPAAGAKGDMAATPPPTAQMVPSSGSATSFAGALQQGGALARYAAAAAAGTPANALPVQSLSIQLRPVELGSVTAHLKYAGSGLTIDIQVETPEAHRRLSNDSSDIVKSLQSLGFQVDKVTVRQALAQPQTQSQGQQQGQAQGQAQGQMTGRDGSAGGFANQGGSPFSMSGQSGGNGHRQGSESGYENASERGIGMVRETADRMPRRGVFI